MSKCGLVTDVSNNHSDSIFKVKQFNRNACSSWAIPLGQYDPVKWCQLLRQQLQPTTTAYCMQTMPSLLVTEKPHCMAAPQLTQSAAVPRVREYFVMLSPFFCQFLQILKICVFHYVREEDI